MDEKSIRKILNEAWKKFWMDPKGFREWETQTFKDLTQLYD